MLIHVLLTLNVIGILRRARSVFAERIGRDFLEEIGVEVLRRCIKEETHHKPREQYVLALGHVTCGREGEVKCEVGQSGNKNENVGWDHTLWI